MAEAEAADRAVADEDEEEDEVDDAGARAAAAAMSACASATVAAEGAGPLKEPSNDLFRRLGPGGCCVGAYSTPSLRAKQRHAREID